MVLLPSEKALVLMNIESFRISRQSRLAGQRIETLWCLWNPENLECITRWPSFDGTFLPPSVLLSPTMCGARPTFCLLPRWCYLIITTSRLIASCLHLKTTVQFPRPTSPSPEKKTQCVLLLDRWQQGDRKNAVGMSARINPFYP